MTDRPTDRELDRLLAELPREPASSGFSRRVLASLDAPARPYGRRVRLLAAAATAAALAVGIWLVPRSAPEPPAAETLALEEEHRRLMQELETLKASLRQSQPPPVLYLGGDERLDLVLDLGPVWQAEPSVDVRPAAYGRAERPQTAGERRRGERR